jgi:hypothetical protein
MNVKKILAMILVLSLLVVGGVIQISANNSSNSTLQGQSEEEIGNNGPDLDDVQEEVVEQDGGDEIDDALEEDKGKVAEVEDDGIVYESEGEEEGEN